MPKNGRGRMGRSGGTKAGGGYLGRDNVQKPGRTMKKSGPKTVQGRTGYTAGEDRTSIDYGKSTRTPMP